MRPDLAAAGSSRMSPAGPGAWSPRPADALSLPLSELNIFDRALLRTIGYIAAGRVIAISGIEHVARERDPFIIALNHSTRLEAVLVPALLMLARHGRQVHFLADWNFRLVPGVGLLYSRSGAITIARKPARPRFLNAARELFRSDVPPLEQARRKLIAGRSIGIFPEGTVNRDPGRLLRGRAGMARLSLETGVPVVPAGIRYGIGPSAGDAAEGAPMDIRIGEPLVPPDPNDSQPDAETTRLWHDRIMHAIARQSGKTYRPRREENGHETPSTDPWQAR